VISPHKLYLYSVFYPVHVGALVWAALALDTFNWLYLLIGWVLVCGLGSAIGLHRVISHKAIKLRPWAFKVLSLIACLAVQGSPLWWASTHRGLHHRFSDTERDPHTPTKGKWHAYHGWLHYKGMGDIQAKYVADLLRSKFQVKLARRYTYVILLAYGATWLISPDFLLWGLMLPAVLSYHQESVVNTWGHSAKLRPREYNTKDLSVNRRVLALFTWGQALHNNHHARPGEYDFSLGQSGKFDPCVLLKWILNYARI
jgi:fatty-acid desaturase